LSRQDGFQQPGVLMAERLPTHLTPTLPLRESSNPSAAPRQLGSCLDSRADHGPHAILQKHDLRSHDAGRSSGRRYYQSNRGPHDRFRPMADGLLRAVIEAAILTIGHQDEPETPAREPQEDAPEPPPPVCIVEGAEA
jgi:hypothetical protein